MNSRLIRFTFSAALGGLLFGFDTAVISGTIPYLREYFSLSAEMEGWTVSSALVGCIFGALAVGKPADVYGRRSVLMVTAILFFISAIGTGIASDLAVFIVFRLIGGVAVGAASVMSPLYISEIAPPKYRGRLVAVSQLSIVTGILLAFFSNFLLDGLTEQSWRLMFLAEGIPSLLFLGSLFLIVRSPRWLVKKGRETEAMEVIQIINPKQPAAKMFDEIKKSLDQEVIEHDVAIFKPPYLRLVFIGIAVGMFNQLTGINVIMYFAPSIFQEAGFSISSSLQQTVLIGFTNLGFTLLAMTLIDKFGRKFLLYVGSVGMTVFLALFAYSYLTKEVDNLLIFLMGYIAFFAFSQGAVIWVLLSEMFPNNVRARGTAIGSFSHWFFNALIAQLFPIAAATLGVGYVFIFFAAAVLVSILFYKYFLVETKGKSLEELESIVLKTGKA